MPDRSARLLRWLSIFAAVLFALYAICAAALIDDWLSNAAAGAPTTDFSIFWTAGRTALGGSAVVVYDSSALAEAAGHTAIANGWPYPPTFLLIVLPLAVLPFVPAFLAWTLATLAVYLAALHTILPRRSTLVLGLAWPPVAWNFIGGQNGFLSAALIGGALACMETRPVIAGVFLGLLSYKPHLGMLFPLVLLLTGRWRIVASATATALVFAGAAWLAFGTETWDAFLLSGAHTAAATVGGTQDTWLVAQTIYGFARSIGVGSAPAWAAQGAITSATAAAVCWIWLRPVSFELKGAALSLGALIVTPHLAIYDFPVAAVPVAYLIKDGLAPGMSAAILALAVAPLALFALAFSGHDAFPVMPPFAILLMILIVARAARTTHRRALQAAATVQS